tara:strand:+ start:147 stop:350 length:204 start_codon:yes stop_codon:yes gene_type:complete
MTEKKTTKIKLTAKNRVDRLAISLFLSLSMQAVIREKFQSDEGILAEWAEDQIAQSASLLFPEPFEA